jgi:cytoskeletal protein RodZ
MALSHLRGMEPVLLDPSALIASARREVPSTRRPVSTAPLASMPRRRLTSARLPIGVFFHLVLVGLVGAGIVGAFFGNGFLLLAQPSKQIQTVSQIQTISIARDSDTEVDLSRPAENDRPSSEGTPTIDSTASEANIAVPLQTVTPSGSAPNSRATSILPPAGAGSEPSRKLSRHSLPRPDKTDGKARAKSSLMRPAKQDKIQAPEEDAAARANQQEFDQLHGNAPSGR